MKRKDAIKDYNYLEMEEKFENTEFNYSELQMIEKKMDRLMEEYHNQDYVPFNRIIRLFCDDAKVYYAMNYLFLKGYEIHSQVDIGCDDDNFVYLKSFFDDYPEAYSLDKQEFIVEKVAALRKKLILMILKKYPDINFNDIDNFTSLKFLNFINNVHDSEIINSYNEYIKCRNELSVHNIRLVFSVSRDNHYVFDDEIQMKEFYLYNAVIGTEKYFQKFYPAIKIVNGEECGFDFLLSSFIYSYAKYMILNHSRLNNGIIFLGYRNELCRKINNLIEDGNTLEEVSSELGYSISEILYFMNLSKEIVPLDEVNEEDIINFRLYDKNGYYSDYKNAIYGGYEEEDTLDDALISEEDGMFALSLLNKLDGRNKAIFMYRYGFVDGRQWTFQEIGDVLGITRQRVNQIVTECEKKLREYVSNNKESKRLR